MLPKDEHVVGIGCPRIGHPECCTATRTTPEAPHLSPGEQKGLHLFRFLCASMGLGGGLVEEHWPLETPVACKAAPMFRWACGLRRLVPQVRSRQEVVGPVLFLAPDENNKALACCDDVAVLKAWVVHGPL